MPLVQRAEGRREWLTTAAVLVASIVAVTSLWGVFVATVGSALYALAGFPGVMDRIMAMLMQPMILAAGALMLVISLGEFGLVRRLLSEHHFAPPLPSARSGGRYGQVAVMGATMAATFGIFCTIPTYLALLVYVATVGSVVVGVLVLGAYGVGHAIPILLACAALRPVGRWTRFAAWLAAKRETIHLAQGVLFAFLGALSVTFFWVRYVVPPPA
jgi:cytochrome c biogenesis protein CcdA